MRKLSVALICAFCVACGSLPNPVSQAETVEQKAFAILGSFEAVQLQAADISEDPRTSLSVVRAIGYADSIAVPAMNVGADLARQYAEAKANYDAAVAAGVDPPARYAAVSAELASWLVRAQPLLDDLIAAVERARQ